MADHESKKTVDHDEIRRWAAARDGLPATVRGTGDDEDEDAGLLRITFRDDPALEQISWDEFFAKFDEAELAFLYQERTKDGHQSRFFKFVERD